MEVQSKTFTKVRKNSTKAQMQTHRVNKNLTLAKGVHGSSSSLDEISGHFGQSTMQRVSAYNFTEANTPIAHLEGGELPQACQDFQKAFKAAPANIFTAFC